jgi:hypothetical protein
VNWNSSQGVQRFVDAPLAVRSSPRRICKYLWLAVATLATACGASSSSPGSVTGATPPPLLGLCEVSVPASQLSPLAQPEGESRILDVTASAACNWTAESRTGFLGIVGANTGSGNGKLTLSINANSGAQRSGTVVINEATLTITQAAAACRLTVAATQTSFDENGGTASATVTMAQGVNCSWTAASNASFITITAGGSGTDNGTVAFRVAPNDAASNRSGSLTIAGQTISIQQSGVGAPTPPLPPCRFTVAASQASFNENGGTASATVTVTQGVNCSWTAASNASFITITAGGSGTDNGTVAFRVAPNSAAGNRSGSLTIAGQTLSIQQSGIAEPTPPPPPPPPPLCTYDLNSSSATRDSRGGSGSVSVTAGGGCAWTAVSNASWLHVTSGSPGNGNGTVGYTVDANPGQPRKGIVTVAGIVTAAQRVFTVDQTRNRCDVNNDNVIDDSDVNTVVQASLTGSTNAAYDINRDGMVNVVDVQVVVNARLDPASCPP